MLAQDFCTVLWKDVETKCVQCFNVFVSNIDLLAFKFWGF